MKKNIRKILVGKTDGLKGRRLCWGLWAWIRIVPDIPRAAAKPISSHCIMR